MTVTLLWIGGGIALVLLVIGIVVTVNSSRSAVEERMGRYIDSGQYVESQGKQPTQLTTWFNERVQKSSIGDNISKSLARADIKLTPGEYIALIVISMVGCGVVAFALGGWNPIMAAAGAGLGFFLPDFYVKGEQKKRLSKFDDQLGDMLNLMVNGLRAGFSTMQAMEAVSKELPAPICDEFRRVVQEMQLGVSMEKTLENLLRRIPSEDLDLTLTAINVQREVGGNLAEILDTISFTIRERVRIKGEIRVLTTQTSYSGRVLSLLPIAVMGILYVLNREYMMEYFKPENNAKLPCGAMALGLSALFIVAGYFTMNKLAEVEV